MAKFTPYTWIKAPHAPVYTVGFYSGDEFVPMHDHEDAESAAAMVARWERAPRGMKESASG